MEILFKNVTIVTIDDENFVVKNGFLGVDDGKISYLSDREPKIRARREIDGRKKVIMPGLVNAHTHIPMFALRGIADDYNLQEWLNEHIFKAEAKLDEKSIIISATLAVAEMISTGTTSITDMYFKEPAICKVIKETGIRGNLSNGSMCFSEKYDHLEDNSYKEFSEMISLYGDDDMIKVDASIHAEYTSNKEVWKFWADLAREKNINIHMHVSETKTEHEECVRKYGKTPVGILSEYGLLDTNASLAHCVFIDEDDMKIIAEKKANVCHNPVSNLKLASGIANITKMKEFGINIALGTDGVASNNTHDLFEEIKFSALLQKGITLDAKSIVAKDALKMATINGAIAQGRDNIGKLKIGFDADIIMVDFDNLSHTPNYNTISSLVYNTTGRDVLLTMVRGKILYENGEFKTIDIKKAKEEFENYVLPRITT